MNENQIKEIEVALKRLGCGRVEIGSDLEIKQIKGDLFNKEVWKGTGEKQATTFMGIAKSPHGSVVIGEAEQQQLYQIYVDLKRIFFSTTSSKVAKKILIFTIQRMWRKWQESKG